MAVVASLAGSVAAPQRDGVIQIGVRPSSASSIDQRRNPCIGDENPKLEEHYPGLDRVTVSLSVGGPLSEALEQLECVEVCMLSDRHRSGRGGCPPDRN